MNKKDDHPSCINNALQSNFFIQKKKSLNLKSIQNNHSFDDFCSQIKKIYRSISISEILIDSIRNPNNLLGEGREGNVYQIEKISDYVVKIPKNYSKEKINEKFF